MNARRPGAHASARVEAQAKLNLLLRVGKREASGYHQLVTLFQRIALADSVLVRVAGRARSLDCAGAGVAAVEENLAWRAAVAFAAAAGWPGGFAIEIHKHIPVGGGLGGGSADAAAVLRALNALAPRPLDPATIGDVALGLGADVPYLLSGHPLALGTGRGERLTALAPLPARDVVLLVPPFGVSSAEAFALLAASRSGKPTATEGPLLLREPLTWEVVAAHATNDLESVVFTQHPELGRLRDAAERTGACMARMTGSGSTIFGVYGRTDTDPHGSGLLTQLASERALLIETTTLERVAPVVLD
ncbi:MAG: 4-(cytidine 5'-diphospho)-2-C-methyl-D-erythritol kinase [Gemmatimonadales bacterium]